MSRERHDQDQAEQEELAQDAEEVDYDLGQDLAQPTTPQAPVDFDLAKDIGIENEPPELRH